MISIVTITYNNFDDLVETIKSLETIDIEHIIVNGGSCLKTLKYLQDEFTGKYISEPDNGISDAFNKGIKLATRDYIAFINSGDTLIDADYFNIALDKISSGFDGVSCGMNLTFSEVGTCYRPPMLALPNCPYSHPGFLFKKEDLLKKGGFSNDLKVAMDFDVFIKLGKDCNFNVFTYDKPAILMDGSGISQVRNDIGIKEKIKSLKANKVMTAKLNLKLYIQLLKALVKKMLLKIGMDWIVNLYKKSIIQSQNAK